VPGLDEGLDNHVLIDVDSGLGTITLNRPRVLNALSLDMIRTVAATLEHWRDDSSVSRILVRGNGVRAFCSGADLTSCWAPGWTPDPFIRTEYRLNSTIADYPKPIVVFMDRIVMGGGVGVAGHASLRVVTERSSVAMPETLIGLSPDAGGTYLLSRTPGLIGVHLGLTGERMTPGDAIYCGFADVFVPSHRLPALAQALAGTGQVQTIVARFSESPPASPLAAQRDWIDTCYTEPIVSAILSRLDAGPKEARQAASAIHRVSPSASAVFLAAIRLGRTLDLKGCLDIEYATSSALFGHPDLPEGIDARIVRRREPAWSQPDHAAVDHDWVRSVIAARKDSPLFAPARR
jgi:enoyl-CoA hydratase